MLYFFGTNYHESEISKEYKENIDVSSFYYSNKDISGEQSYQKDKFFYKLICNSENKNKKNTIHKTKIPIQEQKNEHLIEINPHNNLNDIVVITVFIGFLIMAFVKITGKDYLSNIFTSFINKHFAKIFYRETKNSPGKSKFLLDLNYYINTGTFIAISGFLFNISFTETPYLSITGITFSLILIRILHNIFRQFLSITFKTINQEKEYKFNTSLHRQITGLIMPVINIAIIYSNPTLAYIFVFLGVIILLGMKIADFIRLGNFFFSSQISLLYLFLYLCTLEILPLIAGITAIKIWIVS